MARYEGMDEIVQRLNLRLEQQRVTPLRPGPSAGTTTDTSAESHYYAEAVESTMRLLREAEYLRDLMSDGVSALSKREHDDLLALLAKVLQELWNCEVALQRVAPYE